MSETSVIRLTASGRSAVAVIGLQGPRAAQFVAACFCSATSSPFRDGQIRYGTWQQARGAAGESVVLTPLSHDYFEIHGHGGVAAVTRIIDSLVELGASHVTMNQWDESLAKAASETWEPLIGEAQSPRGNFRMLPSSSFRSSCSFASKGGSWHSKSVGSFAFADLFFFNRH